MDTQPDACAGQFAPLLVGDYRDEDALAEFASKVDVATFDFENVPAESAQWLSERVPVFPNPRALRSEEHTSELQSLMRISYAVFCLKKKNNTLITHSQPMKHI